MARFGLGYRAPFARWIEGRPASVESFHLRQ